MPSALTAAPVFPSLIEEAKHGWDLRLNRPGVPVLLQFKISDYLQKRSALYFSRFGRPHYRFKIWQKSRSEQHEILVKLDTGANMVYYVAPGFHRTAELDDAYVTQTTASNSIFVCPSSIGDLDNEQHYVAFVRDQSNAWQIERFSEPVPIAAPSDCEDVLKRLYVAVDFGRSPLLYERLYRLEKEMLVILRRGDGYITQVRGDDDREKAEKRSVLQRVATLSAIHFNCQLIVATTTSQVDGVIQ